MKNLLKTLLICVILGISILGYSQPTRNSESEPWKNKVPHELYLSSQFNTSNTYNTGFIGLYAGCLVPIENSKGFSKSTIVIQTGYRHNVFSSPHLFSVNLGVKHQIFKNGGIGWNLINLEGFTPKPKATLKDKGQTKEYMDMKYYSPEGYHSPFSVYVYYNNPNVEKLFFSIEGLYYTNLNRLYFSSTVSYKIANKKFNY